MDKDRLVREVEYEIRQLRLLAATAKRLSELAPGDRREWDAQAAAKMIADLTGGLENLCRRRLKAFELPEPEGPDWHRLILEDFLSAPGPGKELSPQIADRLRKYTAFRHRFVHGYGFQVDWRMVEEPLRLIPETVELLGRTWAAWLVTV